MRYKDMNQGMRKGVALIEAASDIEVALAHLDSAKRHLSFAKNEHRTRLLIAIEELKEIHGILTDPECTPEILDEEV